MTYIRFDRLIMTNLQESLQKEVLRSNCSGAYSCSTIVDCNTRKYHGLLVVPVPELDDKNHVLLSSLDETVIQHGAEFNLGLHKYSGDTYSPNGHKYIREFTWEKVPTTVYRIGGVILKKETSFCHQENRILIRYTCLDAHSKTTLRFRPFLAFRSVESLTYENDQIDQHYDIVDNGIRMCLYKGYPNLFMQLSKKNNFVFDPHWYNGIEYPKELERGYDYREDLYVPGYFECDIKKGEVIVFSASTEECSSRAFKKVIDDAIERRKPRDSFFHCLMNASHQFFDIEKDDYYILAGFPWFKCRARDMLIAMPGLTSAEGRTDIYEKMLATFFRGMKNFMEGKPIDVKINEIEKPDVILWAVWCVQQYGKLISLKKCIERYGRIIERLMTYILEGKHPNLQVHENGLVYSEGKDVPVTWMDAVVDGHPVIPRTGYIVEFNALWYNALCFYIQILKEQQNEGKAAEIQAWADKCKIAFKDTFLNEYGYLLDYVDGPMMDWSVRPNQLFAIAFDYSPLELKERKGVLDICTKELLTPKGIRSLSPKSGGYRPVYEGSERDRLFEYYNGTAWPWLEGFYLEAYLRIYKMSGLSFIERQLIGLEDEMFTVCLSTLPEMCDGNPPYWGRGAISYAMSVAEILRVIQLLTKYNISETR